MRQDIQNQFIPLYWVSDLCQYLCHFYCIRFKWQNRKTRMALIIISLITIIGDMLYIIDSSYYFPIAGSFLSGFHYFVNTIAVGEMILLYTPEDTTYTLIVLQTFLGALLAAIGSCYEKHQIKISLLLIDLSNISMCSWLLHLLSFKY